MGRPRSKYICPKCGKQGYLENNSTRNGDYPNAKTRKYKRVVHYNHATKKRNLCYVNYILWEMEHKKEILALKKKLEEMSPTELQEWFLQEEQRNKILRANMRAEQQVFEEVARKHKIKLS